MISVTRILNFIDEVIRTAGGDKENGVTIDPFSETENRVREMIKEFAAPFTDRIYEDAAGNLFFEYNRVNAPESPPILTGSHIDTVVNGGRYDGILGVAASLECMRIVKEHSIALTHPLKAVIFSDEEGRRFGKGFIGSRALIGDIPREELETESDHNGITLYEAMRQAGYRPDRIECASIRSTPPFAFCELHVEQGNALEEEDKNIGIVTGIAANRRVFVTVKGEAAHAGATFFRYRKDAYLGAAEMAVALRRLTVDLGMPSTVSTIGSLSVYPGSINVVPGLVEFSIEIRDIDSDIIERVLHACRDEFKRIADNSGLTVTIEGDYFVPSASCDQTLISLAAELCSEKRFSYRTMPSGACHDTQSMARLCPSLLIFVPSHNGISHNPGEHTDDEDIERGAAVLYETLLRIDQRKV